MARWVYVSAPPASSVTVTTGQRAQVYVPGERTREVTLDPGASADTPVRNQGPGQSLPGPDAGHPLHSAGGHQAASSGKETAIVQASDDGYGPSLAAGDDGSARALDDAQHAGVDDGSANLADV
jgi:hypothetical protein